MGVINRLSWRNLRDGTRRTPMTIIAMAIAATLMVATLVGMRTVQMSLFNFHAKDTAGYMAAFPKATAKQAHQLRAEKMLGQTAEYVVEGPITAPGITDDQGDQYVMQAVRQRDMKQLLHPLLVSGRLPRTNREVVAGSFLLGDHYKLGQTIAAKVAGKTTRYRIVGTVETYRGAGLMPTWGLVRPVEKLPAGQRIVLSRPRSLHKTSTIAAQQAKRVGLDDSLVNYNSDALNFVGDTTDPRRDAALIGTLVGIVGAVAVAALVLIYASLNLTVQAQRQRYGLLRSLGATPAQIRGLVLRQALLLAVPALALGYGAGIVGLSVVTRYLDGLFKRQSFSELRITLQADFWPLAVAGALMLLVTLLAAWRPAWRASRVTPMAAIRDLNPRPKLTQRQLRPGLLERFTRQPMLRLALRSERRSPHKGMLTLILTVAIAIFIGLTGFFGTVWEQFTPEPGADIKVMTRGERDMTRQLRQIAGTVTPLKHYDALQMTDITVVRGMVNSDDAYLQVIVLPDATSVREFAGHATMLNAKQAEMMGNGDVVARRWVVKPGGPRTMTFSDGTATPDKTLKAKVHVVPLSAHPRYQPFLSDQSAGLVLSQTQYAQWQKRIGLEKLGTYAQLSLAQPSRHLDVVAAINGVIGGPSMVTDMVAENQKSVAIGMAMKLAVYGFISILALVCLATIVNSTFAALLAQRRSLATLQSVGTTPGQATLIVQVQHALLFLRGWVYGSALGVLGTYLLFRQMRVGYRGVQVHLPWPGVAVIGLVLILVWCGFALASHRMLAHQNIEQKLRAE